MNASFFLGNGISIDDGWMVTPFFEVRNTLRRFAGRARTTRALELIFGRSFGKIGVLTKPVSHLLPLYPVFSQLQMKLFSSEAEHFPSCLHEFGWQVLISVIKKQNRLYQ